MHRQRGDIDFYHLQVQHCQRIDVSASDYICMLLLDRYLSTQLTNCCALAEWTAFARG
jgi:hypothetical protein